MAIDISQMSDEDLDAQIAALEGASPTLGAAPVDPVQLSDAELDAQIAAMEAQLAPKQQSEEAVTENPAEEKGFWEEVGDIAGDVTTQAISGFREGGIEFANMVLPLYGVTPTRSPEKFDAPEGTAGQITKDITRFVSGYTVFGGGFIKGVGAGVKGSIYLKAAVEGSVRGFVGDYSVTNAQDKTIGNLLKEGGADNMLVTALAVNEDDPLHVKKFKGAFEGVMLGNILSSAYEFGVKPAAKVGFDKLVDVRQAKLDKETEDLFLIDSTEFPEHTAMVADNGSVVMVTKPNNSGQQVMDDLQALQVQDTVDRKMKVLGERRAKFDEEQALADPLKTGDSLKARKQAKKNLFVASKELARIDGEIVKAEEAFAEATKRLDNAPIPKSVIDEDIAEVAIPGPAGPITEGGSLYRELVTNQKNILESLDNLHTNKLQVMEDVTGQKFILRELTEDAQAAAALRNKEALRLRGPMPPQYSEIVLEDIIPLATAKVDPARKVRVPRRIPQPMQRLSPDAADNMMPTNEWDALTHDLFNLPRPIENLMRRVRSLGSTVILRSADSMKSLAKVSRTAAHLSNMIRFDTSSRARKAGNFSYTENAQFMSGKYKANMADVLTKFMKDEDLTRFGNLAPAANKSIARLLRGIDVDNAPEHHKQAAEKLREVLNDFHGEAKQDVPTGFIENFFPRKWRAGDMHKNSDAVKAKLSAAGHSPQRVEEIMRKLVNEMDEDLGVVRTLRGDTDFSWRGSKFLSQGGRTLDIDELDFEEFLEDDIINVLDNYFESGSRKVVYNNMFGYDGGKVTKMMDDIVTESRTNGRPILPEESVALAKLLRNLQGAQKFGNGWDTINGAVGTTMRVMHLGLATLISFGEAFIPFGKAGFVQASKGLAKAVTSVPKHYVSRVLKGIPEPEAYAAAQRVNLALDAAAAERLSSLMGGEVLSAFNRKVNNAFFKATLLTEWVKLVQVAAFHTGRSVITDNLTILAKGDVKGIVSSGATRAKKLRNELESLGVDVEAGIRWVKSGKGKDHPFMEMMDRGSLRFANDSALHPDSAVKPFIQSRPEAMLITQFKAYPTAFANVVLRDWARGLTQGSALEKGTKLVRASTATALILGATSYGMDLREYIQYGDPGNPHKAGQTDEERLLDIVDASGVLGHLAISKHAYDADRYNQEPVLAWFGPAVGKTINLVRAGIDEDERQSILAKEASRAIPNFLPTEVLMSYASNDGSKSVREQVRASLSAPLSDSSRIEPQRIVPSRVTSKGGDLDLFQKIKDLWPDQIPSLFEDDDEGAPDIGKDEVNVPSEEWLDAQIAALEAKSTSTLSSEENDQINASLPPTKESEQLLILQESAKDFATYPDFEEHLRTVFSGDDSEFSPTDASFDRLRPQLQAVWSKAQGTSKLSAKELKKHQKGLDEQGTDVPQIFSSAEAASAEDVFANTDTTAAEFWAKSYNAEHTQVKGSSAKKKAKLEEKIVAYEEAQDIEVLPEVVASISDVVDSGVFAQELEARGISNESAKNVLQGISKVETSGGRNNKISKGGAAGILQVIPSTFKEFVNNPKIIGDRALIFLGKERDELASMSNKEIGTYLQKDDRAGAMFGLAAFMNITKAVGITFKETSADANAPVDTELRQMEQTLRRRAGKPDAGETS